MIDSQTEKKLRQLVDVFLEVNAVVNLSAFRTPEACWTGNILDSIAFLDVLEKLEKKTEQKIDTKKILDLGTGGGFPLLPLAIALPHVSFTGLDATRKKIDAIGRIKDRLEISNVSLLVGRAEELGHDENLRESFDIVLSRAVADVRVLLEYTSPFARPGGHVVLWKSLHIDQELDDSLLARAELSCHLVGQHRYDLGESFGERQLLIFEKSGALPAKYPRAVGVPSKNPLQ